VKVKRTPNSPEAPVPENLVAVGRVVGVHGLRGQLKVLPVTGDSERFEELRQVFLELRDGLVARYEVEKVRTQVDQVFLKLAGVDDRTAAEAFRGAWVSVAREEVPELEEDSFYIFELEGMEVFTPDGVSIGVVVRVEEFPANAVLVIESKTEEIWVPALKEIIREVDTEKKRMTVALPEGLPVYPKGGM
jgi:16S rRNA processing protein RimM